MSVRATLHSIVGSLSVVFLASVFCLPHAWGQDFFGMAGLGKGPVSGTGTAVVKLKPEAVQMSVQLTAKGKNMKAALGKMKDLREAAVLQLEDFGATKDSIKTTPPSSPAGAADRQQQMRQMLIRQRRAQGRKIPEGLKMPKSVTVTSLLTARWPLDSDDVEEILVFVDEIREQVVEADLAGTSQQDEKTPEEEELEAEMSMTFGFDDEESKPGEPQFFFVGTITDEQRQKAFQDAFAKAKTQAEQLASAADITLGKLVSLSGQASQSNSSDYGYMGGGYGYNLRRMLAQQMALQSEDHEHQTLATDLTGLVVQVYVLAAFEVAE